MARWDIPLVILFVLAVMGAGTWMYLHNGHMREVIAAIISVGCALAFVWLLFIKTWGFILKSFD